ncbi:MAG: NAD(P)/FAD-dependent oxidoreductase [Lactobacillaceae bacterium]|jgi:glutathione reductase (NADPH)|nr:NAD(P)/FAD-dependent oxidoreductase [Lactobacillaceae bacterium]
MVDYKFDVGIIGAGPAGLAAAFKAKSLGKTVVVIEKYLWGGTCPNYGCDPKKIMLTAVEGIKRAEKLANYGLHGQLQINWAALQANKKEYTDAVQPRKLHGLDKAGIQHFHGVASFVTPNQVNVGPISIEATDWVIAVGQKPKTLDFPGAEFTLNYEQFLNLPELKGEVAFIGAGYVGMEFATITSTAGTKTHVITHGDSALRSFDSDMVLQVVNEMQKKDVDFHFNSEVIKIEKLAGKYQITLSDDSVIVVDQVFNTAGRVGNHTELNLNAIGVENDLYEIKVDQYLRTNIPNIYAIGDVAKAQVAKLVPTGNFQGRYVAELIQNKISDPIKYPAIASVAFTSPRLAQVGILAKDANSAQTIKEKDFSKWITYYRNHEQAIIKTVLNNDGTVTGGSVYALEAEEIINYLVEAINNKRTKLSFSQILYSYPSYGSDVSDFI